MTYDVIIVGGGPAGLTAAIYSSRSRLKTLLIESYNTPGQAVLTSDIENYPGFPEGLGGFELVERLKKQAEKFGTEFKISDVKNIKKTKTEKNPAWQLETSEGKTVSLSLIIASGARPEKLGIPGEDEFRGKGVSYCATCDGAFFKEEHIVVVGGGNTALEEALFLTKFAKKVTIMHRRDRLRAVEILQERAFANKKIDFAWNSVAEEIKGRDKVESIRIKNIKTNERTELNTDGVFIFIGYSPNTEFLKNSLKLDKRGYVISDENMQTSEKGVFVAGDARQKPLRQIVTAAGDGATAAMAAKKYVDELKGKAYSPTP